MRKNRKERRKAAALARKARSGLATATYVGLLGSSLLVSPAAQAVDQNFVFVQDTPFAETEIVTNDVKIDVTLDAIINNAALFANNNETGDNTNNVNVGNLNQLVDGTQTATSDNLIDIANSGEIDPAIGILGQINNSAFNFTNSYAGGNIVGGAAVISVGDLNQLHFLSQTHTVTNLITIDNSDRIIADQFGIFAEINNTAIVTLFNTNAFTNLLGDAAVVSVGDVVQTIDHDQTSTWTNVIDISNSGDIDPDTGIFAGITNAQITSLFNASAGSNITGTGAIITIGDLDQSIDYSQAITLANTITIDNSDKIVANDTGILGEIENSQFTSLFNSRVGENINGELAIVSAGDLNQDIDVAQNVTLANALTVENAAVIDSDTGIFARVTNDDMTSFFNAMSVSNIGDNASVISLGDHTQSIDSAQSHLIDNDIVVVNDGDVDAGATGIGSVIGNSAFNTIFNSLTTTNEVDAAATVANGDVDQSADIAQTNTFSNRIAIANSKTVDASGDGIDALIENDDLTFRNDLVSNNLLSAAGNIGEDLTQAMQTSQSNTLTNEIYIVNTGNVLGGNTGIAAEIRNENIDQSNDLDATSASDGTVAGDVTQSGNLAQSNLVESNITIANAGDVWGGNTGIVATIVNTNIVQTNIGTISFDASTPTLTQTRDVESSILIDNTGTVGADSLFAIDTAGAPTTIINRARGTITGFIDLTDNTDLFDNQAGGTFEARLTSNFRGGNDRFRNRDGGTVHTADDATTRETTSFINLNRFDNSGLISLQDRQEGDIFEISNTVGGTDLAFNASGNSTLAVDASLGGPGSEADNFVINGDVTGKTQLQVYNTNPQSGELGAVIPVVFANADVSEDAFFLDEPVNAGVFAYDLVFRETGSGVFELRSFIGPNAFILPQLVTAAQDIWHQGSATWFDRTDDLRVWLNGGGAHPATGSKGLATAGGKATGTPAPSAWLRGSGGWLERDASASTSAFGRTFNFDLEREQETVDFQFGLDMGRQGVMRQDDYLIFGLLGGFFHSTLDYNKVNSEFDYNGGQVGAYATYLRGGLFVDTLFNVHFYDLDDQGALRRPGELDGTTIGIRSDAGYRFGSFNGGPFLEPLATLETVWADIDGFTSGGTTVSFNDDAHMRGRLGLRAGTSRPIWDDATIETFVVGSLWGNLTGDNKARVVSGGTTFNFNDDPGDVWGEVSGGINLADPARNASLFAKVDVTFGDDITGVGGKAGIRLGW